MKAQLIMIGLLLLATGCTEPTGRVVQEETLTIGLMTDLSSALAFSGTEYLKGVKRAQDEINAEGGIDGKRVKIIAQDHKNTAAVATSAFRNLEQRDVDMIISTMSPTSVAVAPLAEDSGLPMFTSIAFADIPSMNENSASFFPKVEDDSAATVEDMVENNVKKVGVLYVNTEYGLANLKSFTEQAESAGMTVNSEAVAGSTGDHMTPILKLLEDEPDALYVISLNAIPTMRTIKAMDTTATVYTNLVPIFGNLIDKDPEAFESVHLTAAKVAVPGTAENNILIEEHPDAIGAGYYALGYDSMYVIKAVLEKDSDVSQFVQTFKDYGEFQGLSGTYVVDSRDVGIELQPVVIKDGKITPS